MTKSTKQQLDKFCFITIVLSGMMPPLLEPAKKKQMTVCVFTTGTKLWLADLHDENPGLKHTRFAQAFRDIILLVSACPARLLLIGQYKMLWRESTSEVFFKIKLICCGNKTGLILIFRVTAPVHQLQQSHCTCCDYDEASVVISAETLLRSISLKIIYLYH